MGYIFSNSYYFSINRTNLLFTSCLGLDPLSRRCLWDMINWMKKGRVLVLTTHNMEEADKVSDRVAIINEGKIAIIGTPEEIKAKTGKPKATLEDAFIFFTGNKLQDKSNFREVRQARKTERRLG